MTDLDDAIVQLETEIKTLRDDAEKHAVIFVDFIADAVEKWAPGAVKAFVTKKEEVSERLINDGRFDKLKGEIKSAIPTLAAEVRKDLLHDKLWPHRAGYVDDGSRDRGHVYVINDDQHATANPPHQLLSATESTIERVLGAIFSRYGYQRLQYSKHHLTFTIPDGFLPLIRAYTAVNTPLYKKVTELAQKKTVRAKSRAAEEWDK